MKNKTNIILLLILIGVIVGGSSGYLISEYGSVEEKNNEDKKTIESLEEKNKDPKGEKEDIKEVAEKTSNEEMMIITSPLENDTLSKSSFTVTGRAIAFENLLMVRVNDVNGNKLLEESVKTNATDVGGFGDFAITLSLVATLESGVIEVFEYSAKDGSEINKVSVTVKFSE